MSGDPWGQLLYLIEKISVFENSEWKFISFQRKEPEGCEGMVWDTVFWMWHGCFTLEFAAAMATCMTCVRSSQYDLCIGEVDLSKTHPLLGS